MLDDTLGDQEKRSVLDGHLTFEQRGESEVDVINWCLNATPEEHKGEKEEEQWYAELGERPAFYMTCSTEVALVLAIWSWDYKMGGNQDLWEGLGSGA